LIRLSHRRARSLARLRRRIQEYVSRQQTTGLTDPQTKLVHRQWRESIWADVARLPAAQRDAVLLRFAEGLSYEEVAQTLGCAVGTAKSRVHHGLKRLRLNHEDNHYPIPSQMKPATAR
jgi:RNA polymerase sigma-70 factor (ECF subfamily)